MSCSRFVEENAACLNMASVGPRFLSCGLARRTTVSFSVGTRHGHRLLVIEGNSLLLIDPCSGHVTMRLPVSCVTCARRRVDGGALRIELEPPPSAQGPSGTVELLLFPRSVQDASSVLLALATHPRNRWADRSNADADAVASRFEIDCGVLVEVQCDGVSARRLLAMRHSQLLLVGFKGSAHEVLSRRRYTQIDRVHCDGAHLMITFDSPGAWSFSLGPKDDVPGLTALLLGRVGYHRLVDTSGRIQCALGMFEGLPKLAALVTIAASARSVKHGCVERRKSDGERRREQELLGLGHARLVRGLSSFEAAAAALSPPAAAVDQKQRIPEDVVDREEKVALNFIGSESGTALSTALAAAAPARFPTVELAAIVTPKSQPRPEQLQPVTASVDSDTTLKRGRVVLHELTRVNAQLLESLNAPHEEREIGPRDYLAARAAAVIAHAAADAAGAVLTNTPEGGFQGSDGVKSFDEVKHDDALEVAAATAAAARGILRLDLQRVKTGAERSVDIERGNDRRSAIGKLVAALNESCEIAARDAGEWKAGEGAEAANASAVARQRKGAHGSAEALAAMKKRPNKIVWTASHAVGIFKRRLWQGRKKRGETTLAGQ